MKVILFVLACFAIALGGGWAVAFWWVFAVWAFALVMRASS